MYYKKIAPSLVFARYPASLLRVSDGIILPLRMAAAALHCLAFVICVNDHERLVGFSVSSLDPREQMLHEIRSSLAFTFMFLTLSSFIFITGVLVRFETLHAVQALLHIGGCAMLLAVWGYELHVDRVWHSALVFNLLPLVIDILAMAYMYRRKMLWVL